MDRIEGLAFKQRILESARGVIWRAEQKVLERDVLVLIFNAQTVANRATMTCILQAIRRLAGTKNAIFPDIIDVVDQPSGVYVTMEDVHAQQLLNLLAGRRLNVEQGVTIAEHLAKGFDLLHEAGLVYANLRPENIFINEMSEPMLFDISLLQFEPGQGRNAQTEELDASPVYAAPEQYLAPQAVDTRADMFSLGLTLYALTSGMAPFATLSDAEVMQAKVTQTVASPCDYSARFPAALASLLERLCERDAADRPAEWEEVLFDLHLAQSGEEPYRVRKAANSLIAPPNPQAKKHRPGRTVWLSAQPKPHGKGEKKVVFYPRSQGHHERYHARMVRLQRKSDVVMLLVWGVVLFLLMAIALKVWFL